MCDCVCVIVCVYGCECECECECEWESYEAGNWNRNQSFLVIMRFNVFDENSEGRRGQLYYCNRTSPGTVIK